VEGCEIFENTYAGVTIAAGAYLYLRRCTITRNGYEGVWVKSGGTVTHENCNLEGNTRGPWDIENGAKVSSGSSRQRDTDQRAPTAEDWYNKGVAMLGQERYEEALEAFDRVLSLDCDHQLKLRAAGMRGWTQSALEERS
jgi:tetratricopeptide (TPR) repeat protein